jgi:hypothetical protein
LTPRSLASTRFSSGPIALSAINTPRYTTGLTIIPAMGRHAQASPINANIAPAGRSAGRVEEESAGNQCYNCAG